jgi:hypothetical protein
MTILLEIGKKWINATAVPLHKPEEFPGIKLREG